MSFKAFNSGCNAICFKKNNIKYGMICAWAQMIDYDKISMMLGSQSVTGKNLQIGDIVGVCSLAKHQKNVALALGDNHSDEIDKFTELNYKEDKTAIIINDSKNEMICRVIDIIHFDFCKEDNFIILEILNHKENYSDDNFMSLSDLM